MTPCSKCQRHVPIENKDTWLCATCNQEARDDSPLYRAAKKLFIDMQIRLGVCCPRCHREVDKTFDVHHKAGREGYADHHAKTLDIPLLIDVRFFLAVDRICHQWIENNPKEAKRRGWSLSRTGILFSPLSPEAEADIVQQLSAGGPATEDLPILEI